MRSAKLKLVLLLLLAGMAVLPVWVSAAESDANAAQLKSDLNDIKTRLTALEEGQKEVLAKEDKILEEIGRLFIWVHRK